MFLKKAIWAGLLWGGMLLCSPQLALSEDVSSPLTLEAAIEKTLADNLELKAVRTKLLVKQAQIQTANTMPNPFFLSDSGIAERTYRVGFIQIVELGGKRKRRIELAKAQQAVTAAEIETFILELRTRVRHAYNHLFIAQEKTRIYAMLMGELEKGNQLSLRNTKTVFPDIEAFETEKSMSDIQHKYQQLLSEVEQAQNSLKALFNESSPSDISLVSPEKTATKALPALEELIQKAYQTRPELKETLKNLEATRRQTALFRAQRIPNLILSAGPDLVSNSPGTLDVNAFITGTFELPLLDRQQGPLAESNAQRLQLEAEILSIRHQIALEVKNAYVAWKASEAQWHRHRVELLPKAQAIATQAKAQFNAGTLESKVFVKAHQMLLNTQLSALEALQAQQDAFSDLERAIGSPL